MIWIPKGDLLNQPLRQALIILTYFSKYNDQANLLKLTSLHTRTLGACYLMCNFGMNFKCSTWISSSLNVCSIKRGEGILYFLFINMNSLYSYYYIFHENTKILVKFKQRQLPQIQSKRSCLHMTTLDALTSFHEVFFVETYRLFCKKFMSCGPKWEIMFYNRNWGKWCSCFHKKKILKSDFVLTLVTEKSKDCFIGERK